MAIHIDGDGNFYFGASGTVDFDNITYVPDFSVTKDGVVTANSGTIGGIDLASDHIKSSNYSAVSGSEAGFKINSNGNAEFNNVTIRGDLFGVELKGGMVFNGGDIKTSTTGTRVEILDNSGIEGEIRFETSTGTTARLVADAATEFTIEQSALSGGKIKLVTGVTSDGLQFTGNEINFATPLGTSKPVIKLNGTNANSAGTSTLSKLLGVDSSGRLAVGSSTSGVSSISVTGELQLSGSGGVLNINHNDSDHDDQYYTKSNVNTLLGNKDNYEKWILKGNGNNLNVLSGYGVEFKAGSGISLSVNTSPYEITFSHGGGTHVSSSTAVQALFPGGLRGSVTIGAGTGFLTGSTSNSSNQITVNGSTTRSSSTRMGNIFPNATSSALGFNSSGNYWYRLYAQLSTYVSSDERLKTEIIDIPFGLDYINTLEPKEYELIRKIVRGCDVCNTPVPEGDECLQCDENEDTPNIIDNLDVTGEVVGKKHFGFLAQDLITTPPEPDKDIALVDYNSDEDTYAVAYEELIAPLVKAVQELSTQISDLTARVEALEG